MVEEREGQDIMEMVDNYEVPSYELTPASDMALIPNWNEDRLNPVPSWNETHREGITDWDYS